MKKRPKYTPKQRKVLQDAFLEAMKNTLGIVQPACDEIGISKTTIYRWRQEDKEFAQRWDELQEFQLDFVESKLFQCIQDGDFRAIKFYLACKGKNRGYGEEQVVSVNADVNVTGRPAVRLETMPEIEEEM